MRTVPGVCIVRLNGYNSNSCMAASSDLTPRSDVLEQLMNAICIDDMDGVDAMIDHVNFDHDHMGYLLDCAAFSGSERMMARFMEATRKCASSDGGDGATAVIAHQANAAAVEAVQRNHVHILRMLLSDGDFAPHVDTVKLLREAVTRHTHVDVVELLRQHGSQSLLPLPPSQVNAATP
jgi:hypothetical protein